MRIYKALKVKKYAKNKREYGKLGVNIICNLYITIKLILIKLN